MTKHTVEAAGCAGWAIFFLYTGFWVLVGGIIGAVFF